MKVKATFEFDEDEKEGTWTSSSGDVRLNVRTYYFRDVEVPGCYALLLLDDNRGEEARRLLQELTSLTKVKYVRKQVLQTACEKGFAEAWRTVEAYRAQAPHGPRFYMSPNTWCITFTDGSVGFEFSTDFDVKSLSLPVNVYVDTNPYSFYMNLSMYRKAESHLESFWKFMKRLDRCYDHLLTRRKNKIIEAFFSSSVEGEDEAFALLKDAEKDVTHKIEREEAFEDLRRREVVGICGGYVAMFAGDVYLVSENGEVRKLVHGSTQLEDIVFRLIHGKPTKTNSVAADENELAAVGKIVGKVRPDLALVIIP